MDQPAAATAASVAIVKACDDARTRFTDCPVFSRAHLEALPFAKQAAATEDAWCESDLLYSLLMRPSLHLDRVLGQCREMLVIKNAPDMKRSRAITATYELLMESGNQHVKLFYFLFILHHEPEVQEMMRHGYTPLVGHPLWGERAHSHLADFLHALEPMVKGTNSWPCSDANICDVVHNFVGAARRAYLIL